MAKAQLQEGALGPRRDVDSEEQGLNRLGGKQASASCAVRELEAQAWFFLSTRHR